MEFGVWEGATLNGVAEYRKQNCDDRPSSNFVYGFDTFTGLPEAWGEFRPSVSLHPSFLHALFQELHTVISSINAICCGSCIPVQSCRWPVHKVNVLAAFCQH